MESTKQWPALAGRRLLDAPQAAKITRIYTGITLGLSLAVMLIIWSLDGAIAQTSGLGDMGKRTFLSTLQTILPLGQSLVLLCLDLGFVAAMLRVSRGQYVSPQTLRLGFDRIWVLVRATLLQGLLYVLVGIPVAYLTLSIYMLTPFGDGMVQAILPLMTQTMLSDEGYAAVAQAMEPCLVVCGCAMALGIGVLSYRYRMVNYLLIDKPGMGAMAALRESRRMMKGNKRRLFRLDLRLWWYYAATVLTMAAGDLDEILAALGLSLPVSPETGYYLAWALSLVLTGLTYRFLRGRAEVTWCFFYDAIRPKDNPKQGVVLGNIFQA